MNYQNMWQMVVSVGPLATLLFFVPLWGPQLALKGLTAANPGQVLKPIDQRFSTLDVLVLMTYFAVAFTLVSINQEQSKWVALAGGCGTLLAILLWVKCNAFMNSRGVRNRVSRIIVQLVVFPGSVLSVAYLAISSLMLLSGLFDSHLNNKSDYVAMMIVIAAMLACSLLIIWLMRVTFQWIISREATPEDLAN
jgi:hypothetical protein